MRTSYRQILSIAAPIMLGSAAQNVIALSDSIFLYYSSEEDFATIGFVGVFYLVIAAIGYGISRGGQIIVARRVGAKQWPEVGKAFYIMLYAELFLALVFFAFLHCGTPWFFSLMIDSPVVYQKSLEFLEYRSWGVFFAFSGVALIGLYAGAARAKFIIVDTAILAIVNLILGYGLIFGKFGLPEMGIRGAGLAATIAEAVGLVVFVVYMFLDRKNRIYQLGRLVRIDWELVRQQFRISIPIVAQAVVGLGSWFLFFGIIENLGERALAISNLARVVYLILSIPSWGFASGVNTMVSNFIGAQKKQAVMPIIWKTAKLCLGVTLVISLPVVFFPETLLSPIFGSSDSTLISESQSVLYVLLIIISLFSVGSVYFNGMAGTGATLYGLYMQIVGVILYMAFIYIVVEHTSGGLEWAWAGEILYWAFVLATTLWYMRSGRWHGLKL